LQQGVDHRAISDYRLNPRLQGDDLRWMAGSGSVPAGAAGSLLRLEFSLEFKWVFR